jgi:hypothetical protein
VCKSFCAEGDSVPKREHQPQFLRLFDASSPGGAQPWGRPEGKNGRASPGSLCFFACTVAESLEHPARGPSRSQSRFPFGASIGGRLLVAGKCAAAGPKSHGFLVSFAEPGAIAPVLIPLVTDGKGFCCNTDIRYAYSVL